MREPPNKDRPKAVSGLRTCQSSNVPRRNSSPTTSVAAAVVTSVNAAFGNCSQTPRSSAVTVSHPNLNMYRPGSVTRPTCAQVTLLTANHFPFAFTFLESIRPNSRAFIFTDPTYLPTDFPFLSYPTFLFPNILTPFTSPPAHH